MSFFEIFDDHLGNFPFVYLPSRETGKKRGREED